jgi:hypothetical protein
MLSTARRIGAVFVDAVDGASLRVTREHERLFAVNDYGDNAGAIGCALSHFALWRRIGRGEVHFILEDDIIISEWAPVAWLEQMDEQRADLFYLGWTGGGVSFDRSTCIGGTFAYMLNYEGARTLLSWFEMNGCPHGIDYCMLRCVDALRVGSCPQRPITSQWVVRGREGDSDIQSASAGSLNLYANYEFSPGLDHIGDDLECVGAIQLAQILRRATLAPNCNAFNDAGFLKRIGRACLIERPCVRGIWIKRPTRIQVECNWTSSERLAAELNAMRAPLALDWQWQFVWDAAQVDYWFVINSTRQPHDPSRSIHIRLEPSHSPHWTHPPGYLRTHTPTIAFWQIDNFTIDTPRHLTSRFSIILSEKYADVGHRMRVDLVREIERRADPRVCVDVYGRENYHNLASYRGPVGKHKETRIASHSFYLAVENCRERDYVTEKFWECILCLTVPLYWGCTNIQEILPCSEGLVLLGDDVNANFDLIRDAMSDDGREKRLAWLHTLRQWVLSSHNIFAHLDLACTQPPPPPPPLA